MGAAIMCQISHLGRRADAMGWNWLPTIAPSPIRETRHRNFPREMDEHDIQRVINDFATAVKRCKEGGLDGVETMTGGHLIGPVPFPADQPTHRPLRRLHREPRTVRPDGARGDAQGSGRRLPDRHPLLSSMKRTTTASNFDECRAHRPHLRTRGPDRLLQRHLRPHGHRPLRWRNTSCRACRSRWRRSCRSSARSSAK